MLNLLALVSPVKSLTEEAAYALRSLTVTTSRMGMGTGQREAGPSQLFTSFTPVSALGHF